MSTKTTPKEPRQRAKKMQIFQKSSGDGGKRALEKRLTYCPLFAEEKGT